MKGREGLGHPRRRSRDRAGLGPAPDAQGAGRAGEVTTLGKGKGFMAHSVRSMSSNPSILAGALALAASTGLARPSVRAGRPGSQGLALSDNVDDVGKLDVLAVLFEGDLHHVPLPGVWIVERRVGGALREAGGDLVAGAARVRRARGSAPSLSPTSRTWRGPPCPGRRRGGRHGPVPELCCQLVFQSSGWIWSSVSSSPPPPPPLPPSGADDPHGRGELLLGGVRPAAYAEAQGHVLRSPGLTSPSNSKASDLEKVATTWPPA